MNSSSAEDDTAAQRELVRERDLQKYYQPWLDSNQLQTVPNNDALQQSPTARCSHDTTLTALAQLAALRLDVKRGMVSLIDATNQIILAEATKTLSLVDQTRHQPGDHIWLGQVSLPRKDCMDEHVFGATWTAKDSQDVEHKLQALVINDVANDDRFKDRSYVLANPGVRFYAGVPIVTRHGNEIGVYAVSDTHPRPQGLSLDQVLFMQDVAQIVTQHLERVKGIIDGKGNQIFVQGMHTFIDDVSNLKHELESESRISPRASSRSRPDIQATDPQQDPVETHTASAQSMPSPPDSSAQVEEIPRSTIPKHWVQTDTPIRENTEPTTDNVKQIYERAASCIVEAMDARGCVFLDASFGIFSPNADSASNRLTRPKPRAIPQTEFDTNSRHALPDADLDKMAIPLGNALSDEISESFNPRLMKRKHLKTFFERYPNGQFFHLKNQKAMRMGPPVLDDLTNDAANNPQALLSSPRVPHIASADLPQQLLDQLHEAKVLAFLPLFSHAQGQWCAGAFIWTNEENVHDVDTAMPYLRTFGSCLVSEVTSMEAFNTSLAKSTFIASMSHDLRSPLHGMLGSLEFLEDTMTSAYQSSLLGSIETCGKTLLDTIDHLLDYAKINDLNRATLDRRSGSSDQSGKLTTKSSTFHESDFDLSLILEEVVEAVFAGQTFRKSRLRGHDPVDEAAAQIQAMGIDQSSSTEELIHAGSAKFSGKVFFVLDVQKARSWCMRGQTGGIRRVILNVVGNAIKYCSEGCIEIVLERKPIDDSHAEILIKVKDTGIGMSQRFLENHLFKAFSQEDSFAPGAGLGLSIASQIIQNLQGKIRVQSEKGIGTHVTITLPMEIGCCNHEHLLDATRRTMAGKNLCFLNPLLDGATNARGQLSKLTESITRTCEDWFEMTCSESDSVETERETSIYVYCEPPPIEYLLKYHSERRESGKSGKEAALLIVCTNAFEAAALRAAGISQLINLGRIVEVISQPVGARKLAKVLLQSLQRIEQSTVKNEKIQSSEVGQQLFRTNEAQQRAAEVKWHSNSSVYDQIIAQHRPSIEDYRWKSDNPLPTKVRDKAADEEKLDYGDIKAGKLPGLGNIAHASASTTDSEKQPPSVLVVDDNAINLKLLVTFMKKIKLPYAEAMNGLEAFNKFKEADRPFNFVLMDLQMPVMDGLESTRKIREFEKESKSENQCTVIAITGVGNEAVRKDAMDAGMSYYITKPVKFKALQQMLEQEQK